MTKLAWLGVALSLVACTKGDFDANTSHAKVSEAAFDRLSTPVTVAPPGLLESRVLDLADCALEGTQVTSMCPAMQTLAREVERSARLGPDVVERLLGHRSAAVRVQAAALSADRTLVVNAARREREPQVRQALVKLLAGDPRITSFTTDPHADVRREVVAALASHGTPAGSIALAHLIESDPDTAVRADACRLAGNLVEDSLLPMFERTTAVASDPALRDACMEGLSTMVLESEGAHRLFLRRVVEGVRPWQAMSAFCPFKAATRPGWFSVEEVRTVLVQVIEDPTTSPLAVAAARESLDTLLRQASR
ncbi:MAG: HEAT repeat domain-containing protein [Kofleriaceae bacterium]